MSGEVDLDDLASRARAGDREAFRALVLATQRDLAIALAAYAVSREQVDEVMQQTYVTCFEKIALYRPGGTFRAWIKAIARNHLMQHWRERRRFVELDGNVVERLVAADALAAIERDDGLPEQETRRLAECLDRLPAHGRALIERRYREQMPLARLAQQFKRSAATLSVALFRLRRQLRRCMEQSG